MKILTTSQKVYGPFNEIIEDADGWVCDGSIYPLSVLGAGEVSEVGSDYVNPLIIEEQRVRQNAANKISRGEAYRLESDPLFFKAQRGEATMEEWQAKVDEIKLRYPYQE